MTLITEGFFTLVGILFLIILIIIQIGMCMWFCWAIGCTFGEFTKIKEEKGGFWGLVVGFFVGIYVVVTVFPYMGSM